MVIKKIETRDYLRSFITRANKEAEVTFNASKLNSIKECEEYLLNLIKDLRHKPQDNKAYIKEIDSLKEEIEILNKNLAVANREKVNLKDKFQKLEAERIFYITQAKEAGEKREGVEKEKEYYRNHALSWNESCHQEIAKNKIISDFNIFLSFVIVLEALSIAMLIWKQ
jgi:chromosome segregation ATPase